MTKYLVRHKAGIVLTNDASVNLALLIVKSGVEEEDEEFLKSEWCAELLDFLDVTVSGPELLERKRSVDNAGTQT